MKSYGEKMSAGKRTAVVNALEKVTKYYQPIRDAWGQATPEQREAYLAHSPILKALIDFARPFVEVRP